MPSTPTPETIYSGPPLVRPPRVTQLDEASLEAVERELNRFIAQVFGWITGALLISAFFASYSDRWEVDIPTLISINGLFFLLGAMLLAAFLLSRTVGDMPTGVAIATLAAYASGQGTLFGLIYRLIYGSSLTPAYLLMALLFGVLCTYALRARRDPTSTSCLLFGAGFALVLAGLSKLLLDVPTLTACATCACSWLLLSLAAYHRDFLRNLPSTFEDDVEWHKAAAIGALQIYLDLMIIVVIVLQARWLRSSLVQLTRKESKN